MVASHVEIMKPEIQIEHLESMRLAVDEARLAAASGEVPVGAILITDGAVIARAHNQREALQDPTAHAELIAIREAASHLGSWRLTGSTLYVTMEPCAMCVGAAILARVERVVFGAWDAKAGACGSLLNIPEERRLNHRIDVVGGVLEEDSRELLQRFFQGLREKNGTGVIPSVQS